jgi:hypothetical protein
MPPMQGSSAFQILKPFAWLASASFMVGFVSYLALGPSSHALAREEPRAPIPAVSDVASGPASQDWNFEKKI